MFDLEIKFTGLIMYLVHADPRPDTRDPSVALDARKVTVVIPECRRKFSEPSHADGRPGAHHVGYLRMDLAGMAGAPARVPPAPAEPIPGLGDPVPPYEVTHRFTKQTLDFGLPEQDSISVRASLPEFDRVAPALEPRPELFDQRAGDFAVMRATLTGGSFTGEPKQKWKFSSLLNGSPVEYSGEFAPTLTWTRTVRDRDSLTLTLDAFAGGDPQTITLYPVPGHGGKPTISLKIANLCCENPLEWPELDPRNAIDRDDDFKWLYRLMQPARGRTLKQMLTQRGNALAELPIPLLDGEGRGGQGCVGCTVPVP
jgi:hypothetical protein